MRYRKIQDLQEIIHLQSEHLNGLSETQHKFQLTDLDARYCIGYCLYITTCLQLSSLQFLSILVKAELERLQMIFNIVSLSTQVCHFPVLFPLPAPSVSSDNSLVIDHYLCRYVLTDSLPQIFFFWKLRFGVLVTNSQDNSWDTFVGFFSKGLPFKNFCWAVFLLEEWGCKHRMASGRRKNEHIFPKCHT